jgi:heme exporter protein A
MTPQVTITAKALKKVFNRRVIFESVSFSLAGTQTLLISGRNGSGKSTLVKIIAGVLSPTGGSLTMSAGGVEGDFGRQALIGLVSPYLQMYEEFSADENLRHASAIRGLAYDREFAHELLHRVALFSRKDDPVRTYSSGMKQRMKYVFALVHRPGVLILDEPMSNLDAEGIEVVRGVMDEHRRGGTLIVATNDLTDLAAYDERVDLNAQS